MKRLFVLLVLLAPTLAYAADPAPHTQGEAIRHEAIATGGTDANVAGTHAAGGHEAGAAHPEPSPFAGTVAQAVAALVVFGVVFFVLHKYAWPQILGKLEEREGKIRDDLKAAESARIAAESKLAEYNGTIAAAEERVRTMLSKAQSDAEAIGTRLRAQATAEVLEIKERSTKELEAARVQAIREVHEQAAEISTSLAEKIIRRNLNADDQRELVRSALAQLSSTN